MSTKSSSVAYVGQGRSVETPGVLVRRADTAALRAIGDTYAPLPWKPRAWMLTLPVDIIALSAPALGSPEYRHGLLALAALSVALLADAGRYRARLFVSLLDELPSLVGRTFTAAALVACVIALRHTTSDVAEFLRAALVAMALLVVGRAISNYLIVLSRRLGAVAHPTVIVGAGPVGVELKRLLDAQRRYGLQVVGVVDDELRTSRSADLGTLRTGSFDELAQLVGQTRADVLLVADPALEDPALLASLSKPQTRRCDLLVVPRFNELHTQTGLVDHIGAIPVMRIRRPALSGAAWLIKRVTDLVLASVALVILSPVLLACAVAVRIEGGKGIFFTQERITADGRVFKVIKFRSLTPVDDNDSATTWSVASSSRLGPVGRVLRKTSLDELPQLYNILRGDMTFVGPRPERPFFVAKFSEEHPHYGQRHRVRSGLTGLAQVSGLRGDTSISDRARHDNFYIENWSLWLDVKIILRTIGEVVRGGGG